MKDYKWLLNTNGSTFRNDDQELIEKKVISQESERKRESKLNDIVVERQNERVDKQINRYKQVPDTQHHNGHQVNSKHNLRPKQLNGGANEKSDSRDSNSNDNDIRQLQLNNINNSHNSRLEMLSKPANLDHQVTEDTILTAKPAAKCKRQSLNKASNNSATRDVKRKVKKEEPQVNLSFCGCGFLGIYHVGVASCFHEYAPQLSMQKISGSSVGSLVAVAHICGNLQLAYATTDILRVAIDARARTLGPFHPAFDINANVREALERALPDDVHLKASGKLHVSLTRVYDGENIIISQFESKEDVIQVLLCSCFIPIWSGLRAPKYKGVTYIDGGFSNNLLTLDSKTVTVSPFAGEADICPQDDTLNLLQVSLSNTSFSLSPDNLYRLSHALLPPSPEVLSSLCEQGFADGIRFLQRMKLISCVKCLEIRSSLLVTTNGEDIEETVKHEVSADLGDQHLSSWSRSGESNCKNLTAPELELPLDEHIRLERQEQKMIEINDGDRRRDSVVSSTNQPFGLRSSGGSFCNLLTIGSSNHQSTGVSSLNLSLDKMSAFESLFDLEIEELNCDECVMIRREALSKNLPEQFSDRIRDACDTVNKSLSNWVYSHRPIKYLSYLAAPYYLPFEISLALMSKCWRSLPMIRAELMDIVEAIAEFLLHMIKRIQEKSTSALMLAPMSLVGGFFNEDEISKESAIIEQKETNSNRRQVARKISRSSRTNQEFQQHQQQTINSHDLNSTSEFSLKITSDGLSLSKRQISNSSNSINSDNYSHNHTHNQHHLHSLEDTFDSIVDVTSNQEARIFAYYFRDAKNRLQVTEIFDLERAAQLANHQQPNSVTN